MIENPMNNATQSAPGELPHNQTLESVALAGAAAIQRLIAERNTYYQQATNQQRDLVALRAINEDLKRRIVLIRERYVGVGRTILAQLEQLDQTTREAMGVNPAQASDANVLTLGDRLKHKDAEPWGGHREPA
jgi:hypothetical protein